MSYATIADFLDGFDLQEAIALTNQADPTATTVDETELQAALDNASAEIDLYVGGRYDLPLTNPPAFLSQICLDVSRYRLEHGIPREDVRQRYEDALRKLEAIASGKIQLPTGTGSPSDAATRLAEWQEPTRVWDSNSLSQFS